MKYQAFMAHLDIEHFDYLEEKLQEYNIGSYIIGHETSKYPHFHFMVQMEDEEYHNFAQAVFKKKFKLRGRAIKDNPRQYGKVTNINNLDKMKSYTVKEGNYRTNLSDEEIKTIYDNSFEKVDRATEIEKLFVYLDSQVDHFKDKIIYKDYFGEKKIVTVSSVKDKILHHIYLYINTSDNNLSLSRTAVNGYFLKYLRKTELLSLEDRISLQKSMNGHLETPFKEFI